ncbi:ORF039 [Infectious spleen and kidney necrosis virus]|nr:ORF039 [Infectious spleen and kidney necrosis virus]
MDRFTLTRLQLAYMLLKRNMQPVPQTFDANADPPELLQAMYNQPCDSLGEVRRQLTAPVEHTVLDEQLLAATDDTDRQYLWLCAISHMPYRPPRVDVSAAAVVLATQRLIDKMRGFEQMAASVSEQLLTHQHSDSPKPLYELLDTVVAKLSTVNRNLAESDALLDAEYVLKDTLDARLTETIHLTYKPPLVVPLAFAKQTGRTGAFESAPIQVPKTHSMLAVYGTVNCVGSLDVALVSGPTFRYMLRTTMNGVGAVRTGGYSTPQTTIRIVLIAPNHLTQVNLTAVIPFR